MKRPRHFHSDRLLDKLYPLYTVGCHTVPDSNSAQPTHNTIPTRLCPNCQYDLRAQTHNICPECGQPFDPQQAQFTASSHWKHERLFQHLAYIPLAWLVFYFVFGKVTSAPVDRPIPLWVKATFLNVPLLIALTAIVGLSISAKNSPKIKKTGAAILVLALTLIAGNILLIILP